MLTRRTHSTNDDPCRVLKIAVLHTSTLVRGYPLPIGDLQARSILRIASCLLMTTVVSYPDWTGHRERDGAW